MKGEIKMKTTKIKLKYGDLKEFIQEKRKLCYQRKKHYGNFKY